MSDQPFDYQSLVPTIASSPQTPRMRLGVVQAVTNNYTCSVKIAASNTTLTGIRYLTHVAPRPGAAVWVTSDGFDLFVTGIVATSGEHPSARLIRTTNQTIANGTPEMISFSASAFPDLWSMWNPATPTRLTAQIPGKYLAQATVQFAANATGHRGALIQATAGGTTGRVQVPAVIGGTPTWLNVSTAVMTMVVGDYVELEVVQTSGGPLAVTSTSEASPTLSLVYLGP